MLPYGGLTLAHRKLPPQVQATSLDHIRPSCGSILKTFSALAVEVFLLLHLNQYIHKLSWLLNHHPRKRHPLLWQTGFLFAVRPIGGLLSDTDFTAGVDSEQLQWVSVSPEQRQSLWLLLQRVKAASAIWIVPFLHRSGQETL